MENWRDVVGWGEFYEVSDLGRVKSKDRVIEVLNPWGDCASRKYHGRILRSSGTTYPMVSFTRPGSNRARCYVHSIVMAAFVGPVPPGLEVCHNDGDKRNNRLTNLRYDTRSANSLDRHIHGTVNVHRGETNPNAKLNRKQVEEIRESMASHRALSVKFDVSHSRIGAVRRGECYK